MRRCDVNVNSVDIRRSSMTTATATRRRRQNRARENCRLNTYDIGMAWHFVVTMTQNIWTEKCYIESTHNLFTNCLIAFHVLIFCCYFVLPSSLMPMALLLRFFLFAPSYSLVLSTFLFVLLVFEPLSSVLMLWHCFDALVYECVCECECVYYERSATAIRSHFLSFVRWAHISKEFNHLRVCIFVRVWIFDIWPQ